MKNAVLVLGYNNTRINDVRKIQQKANDYLDAKTVLCKKSPTAEDNAAADYVIDVGLDASEINVEKVRNYCTTSISLKWLLFFHFQTQVHNWVRH